MEEKVMLLGEQIRPFTEEDWGLYQKMIGSGCIVLYGYLFDREKQRLIEMDLSYCVAHDFEDTFVNGRSMDGELFAMDEIVQVHQERLLAMISDMYF